MRSIQALPLLLALASAACLSGSPAPTSTAADIPQSPQATLETAEPTAVPTASPSPTGPTPPAPPTSGSPLDIPPQGALGYSDVADVGWLGSFCWQGTCGDVPSIPPKAQLPEIVIEGDSLTFSLVDGEFGRWIAQYGAEESALTTLADGGETFDPDVATIDPDALLSWVEFDAPPAGDWVVRVQAFFVDGDASYYWHVIVP